MVDLNQVKTINGFLDNSARIFPNKVGLVFEESKYTYSQIQERSQAISCVLAEKTDKGDVIALLLPNIPEMIFSYFGILGAGCTVLLLPANISDKSLIFQVGKTKPKLIVSQKKYQAKLARTDVLNSVDYIDVENICLGRQGISQRSVSEDDISTIIFTSGTTSEPKGVKLKHKNVVNATKNIIEFLKWDQHDTDVNILQLSHSFGLGNIHCVFAVGAATILFRDSINLKKIIKTIIDRQATTFAAVPATLRMILSNYSAEFSKCDKYLRFIQTNTSSLEPELIKGIFSVLPNTDFNYYYGLSEASRSTFITLNKHLDKISSVGKACPNVELKIIGENKEELPAGQAGEICIKGRHVVKEYWDNPEATKKIQSGWLCTNDFGFLDKEKYLYLKGRQDDIINVSGEKVSPEEIENIVKKIPGVVDAGAIGVSDKLLGETIKLFIAVKDRDFNPDIVIQECRKNLESHKIPRTIEIIKEIPRTESGKLRRSALKN